MTWAESAGRVEQLVDHLTQAPVEDRRLKVAWVSTWNTRCGIANYSESLVANTLKDWLSIDVFANHQPRSRPNEAFANHALWRDRQTNLDALADAIIEGSYDAVVFQYNYGFYTLESLALATERLEADGIAVYIFFHKTEPAVIDARSESIALVASALSRATRLVVHSVDDVNRLKSFGLCENVVKLPQGASMTPDVERLTMRRLLGLAGFQPIIASYGFLLPDKGLPELIVAFSQLLSQYPTAFLLMVNSIYPDPLSDQEHKVCLELVAQLGLSANVIVVNQYLPNDESMMLLQASDVIVFPYQDTAESSSAAVRQGLSAQRPVLVTPLPIFNDIGPCAHRSSGGRSHQIAGGIDDILQDPELGDRIVAAQRAWLTTHDWRQIGERLSNMIVGLHQDRHGVILRPTHDPSTSTSESITTSASDAGPPVRFERLKDEAFIRAAYQHALGRDADGDGLKSHLGNLRAGRTTKGEIMEILETSDEGRTYLRSAGKSITLTMSDFGQSSEEQFVRSLYTKLLRRDPDEEGLRSSLAYLQLDTTSRRDLVEGFLKSDEFLNNNFPIRVL